MSLHTCTDEELDRFYPPEASATVNVEKWRKLGAFKCLDWELADFDFTGGSGVLGDGKTYVDISAHPCHFRMSSVNGFEE